MIPLRRADISADWSWLQAPTPTMARSSLSNIVMVSRT
jgi:hypothetical protein